MKACDRWKSNYVCSIPSTTGISCGSMTRDDCAKIREIGWRAALEWAKDRLRYHYGDELSGSDIVKDINEELDI